MRLPALFFLLLAQIPFAIGQSLPDTIITLKGIEIREKAIQSIQPLTIIESDLMERTSVVDMGEILRSQPNISGIRRGGYAVDPVVRGFRYSQINISLDEGIHIEGGCPNRMDPVLAHILPGDIQRLEVTHGPYQLKYGPSLGSSIRVTTRKENLFSYRKIQVTSLSGYDAGRSGFRQHLALWGSSGNMFYRVSGGYMNYGNYTDGSGREWNTGFTKYGFSADAGIRFAKHQQLELSYKGSFARDVLFPALPMDETADNTNILSAVYTIRNPNQTDDLIKIAAHHSMVYHEMDNSRRPQHSVVVPPYQGLMQAVAKVDARSSGVRIAKQKKLNNYMLEGGYDIHHTYKDGNRFVKMIMQMDGQEFISERSVSLWKNARSLNNGLFAGISTHGDPLQLSATLRTDLNHSNSGDTLFISKNGQIYYDAKPTTHAFWSFSTNAAWQFTEQWKLSLGLGRGVRPPDLSERYIQFLATGFDRYDYLGNPELKPEVNYQADLMLEYSDENFHFFTNMFRADIRNFISGKFLPPSVARPQSMGAPGVKQFENMKQAIFYGFESGLSAEPATGMKVSLNVGYTYAYFPGIEKILLENGQAIGTEMLINDPVPEMPAMESNFRFSYLFPGWHVEPSLEIRTVASQKQVSEASYEEGTPGYIIPNIGLAWQPRKNIRIMAGVNNLFDKAYYDHLNRRIIGTGGNFYEPGRSLFVNLKITL
jgi:iron complex outermembrane recepter protein